MLNSKNKDLAPVSDMVRAVHVKAAQKATPDDLALINTYALEPLTADDVFCVCMELCDNDVDRQFEQFDNAALDDMEKLFVGRTVLCDHSWKTASQTGRIYRCTVEDTGEKLPDGRARMALRAWVYILRTDERKAFIADVLGGIKKEGSVGFMPGTVFCSICGADNRATWCPHWPGETYKTDDGEKTCVFRIASVVDAYEFSFVAVPAQKRAGALYVAEDEAKTEDGCKPTEKPEDKSAEQITNQTAADAEREKELALRVRLASI